MGFRRKRIFWVDFLVLDTQLHRASRIQILRHLALRGYEVALIAVHSKKKPTLRTSDLRVISIPLRDVPLVSSSIFTLLLLLFFPFLVLYSKPSYVIVEQNSIMVLSLLPVLLLPRSIRPKIVLDIRSTPVENLGPLRHLIDLCFNISVCISYKVFDGMTIITRMMRKEVSEKFDIDPEVIGVWTSGVPTDLFNPVEHAAEGLRLRKRFGLSDRFVIMYHGALSYKRGIFETIESISMLRDRCPGIALFLIGSGPAVSSLKSLIQTKGVQDRVLIHEPVDYEDLPAYIMMCDVGIVPLPNISDWRNQCPLKLLEYLAMEKVVITTDIPANREVVGERECGIYALSSEPKEIAQAILCAVHNREKLREWGRCGRELAMKRYRYDKVAEDLEKYLLDL